MFDAAKKALKGAFNGSLYENLSFKQRAENAINPLLKQIFSIMEDKQSNLVVAADVTSKNKLLTLAEKVGPKICMLKTHLDIIDDFDHDLVEKLRNIAEKHDFLIIEDRKFADIGNTVKYQFTGGIHKIVEAADIIIIHCISGPGIIDALKETCLEKKCGILILAQMSSKGNLIDDTYTKKIIEMADNNSDIILGFISQEALKTEHDFLFLTPGVKLTEKSDTLGQQYNSPEYVIGEKKSDIIIVGRGIYQSKDPLNEAEKYRKAAWNAYRKRIE